MKYILMVLLLLAVAGFVAGCGEKAEEKA